MASKGLLILEEEDFELVETDKVIHLTHTVSSKFSIVMFYTDECDQCRVIKPILLSFVGNPLVQICMVNVYDPDSTNLIQISQKTTTPLKHVPFIVFYVNGIPFKRFDGAYNHSDFQSFVKNVMAEASKLQDTSKIGEIPPYTTGKPNSSKVCYLPYQKAYVKN
jgi:thiol-disulfide isomerase/thioredoxin